MQALPVLKLFGLVVRTLAKPIANKMKKEAPTHPVLSRACGSTGQFVHQVVQKILVRASGYNVISVKPLEEKEAIQKGINFISEVTVFAIGGTILCIEYWRSQQHSQEKAALAKQEEAEFNKNVENRFKSLQFRIDTLRQILSQPQAPSALDISKAVQKENISKEKSDMSPLMASEIDGLGVLSGIAQELKGSITSTSKLAESDHALLVYCNLGKAVGYIKYGMKQLYFYKKDGKVLERNTLSLLDFYVSESEQRQGIGAVLFSAMLEATATTPMKLAYDRPSPKLTAFLRKHYNMTNPDLQPNRYAIYDGFFD